ncbi:ankyrin repeat domain-containing protein [Botryobacter ruber]|uniref:ankyrin repeat domain-containing protein n=1 Tax=Botryobacter ruber TaxID=2171629 RepID=UPI000E0BC382|nr:ankyrin repeat domain-containing protein [Botryobacter ruber]
MKNIVSLLFLLLLFRVGVAQEKTKNPATPPLAVDTTAAVGWRTPETKEAVLLYISLQPEAAYAKFREAAAKDDPDAFYFMGRLQQHGELKANLNLNDTSKLKNPEIYFAARRDSARYFYEQAIKGNSMLGHLGIAELMTLRNQEDERLFTQHMRSAAIDIRERAIDGDAFSCRILGSMYYTGYGVWKDRELAIRYFQKAAEKGDLVSYGYIGSLYQEGEGVPADMKQAVKWFKKGAEAGEREASYSLGLYYEETTDGNANIEEAKKWYQVAMEKGSQNAYEQLKYLGLAPETRLIIGAMDRNAHLVERALEQGADINSGANPAGFDLDFRGRTALMHAVYLPHLLEGYGTVYDPDKRVQTVSLLLQKGADINKTDQDGKTALHYAVSGTRVTTETFEQEQLQLLDTLLQHGAAVNVQDSLGNTPLIYAMEFNKGFGLRDVEMLIKAGADVNVQNKEGKTALMVACEKNYTNESVLILISAGADATLRDNNGRAAIDFTKKDNIRNILFAAGSPEPKVNP